MIEWLNKIAGNSSGSNNAEKEEYMSLKKEVRRYRKKVYNFIKHCSMQMRIKKTK